MAIFHKVCQSKLLYLFILLGMRKISVATDEVGDGSLLFQDAQTIANFQRAFRKTWEKWLSMHEGFLSGVRST
jgi:hypothetical protein